MSNRPGLRLPAVIVLVTGMLTPGISTANYKDDIGYNALSSELGSSMPTGSNVPVTQVEASSVAYMPNTNFVEFLGKTFHNVTGTSTDESVHASAVGQVWYGTSSGISPGITNIFNYNLLNWYYEGFLKKGDSSGPPSNEVNRIQNHSWVGSGDSNGLRRLDYAVERDGFVAVVGLGNTNAQPIPALLAHAYNIITVGMSGGTHSYGATTFDDAGRVKPDIVAPMSVCSYAVPLVSGAAAMILDKAQMVPALAAATNPQCVKAILLAGATKDEFPSWARTRARPLDSVYGAGELNVYNSYHVLTAGRQAASATNTVGRTGWDFVTIPQGTSAWWFIDVPASNVMTRLSIAVVWHRRISSPVSPFNPIPFVPDLDMYLHTATNFTPGPVIDCSTSRVDNLEHIYQRYLAAGRYAIEVTASNTTTNCAIAWYGATSLIPPITNIATVSSNIQFSATVSPGVPYAVEVSTNLTSTNAWSRIATNTAATNIFTYVETNTAGLDRRFYRIVPDP